MGGSPPLNALPLRYPIRLYIKYTIYIGYLQVETLENLGIFLPPNRGDAKGGAGDLCQALKEKEKGTVQSLRPNNPSWFYVGGQSLSNGLSSLDCELVPNSSHGIRFSR